MGHKIFFRGLGKIECLFTCVGCLVLASLGTGRLASVLSMGQRCVGAAAQGVFSSRGKHLSGGGAGELKEQEPPVTVVMCTGVDQTG